MKGLINGSGRGERSSCVSQGVQVQLRLQKVEVLQTVKQLIELN